MHIRENQSAAGSKQTRHNRRWNSKYAAIGKLWRRHWAVISPQFACPEEIRESALKLLYLALRNIAQRWRAAPNWRTSLNHFLLLWGDRIEAAAARIGR